MIRVETASWRSAAVTLPKQSTAAPQQITHQGSHPDRRHPGTAVTGALLTIPGGTVAAAERAVREVHGPTDQNGQRVTRPDRTIEASARTRGTAADPEATLPHLNDQDPFLGKTDPGHNLRTLKPRTCSQRYPRFKLTLERTKESLQTSEAGE